MHGRSHLTGHSCVNAAIQHHKAHITGEDTIQVKIGNCAITGNATLSGTPDAVFDLCELNMQVTYTTPVCEIVASCSSL